MEKCWRIKKHGLPLYNGGNQAKRVFCTWVLMASVKDKLYLHSELDITYPSASYIMLFTQHREVREMPTCVIAGAWTWLSVAGGPDSGIIRSLFTLGMPSRSDTSLSWGGDGGGGSSSSSPPYRVFWNSWFNLL